MLKANYISPLVLLIALSGTLPDGSVAQAASVQSGKSLKLPADNVVDDDLIFFGRSCRLTGEVVGDAALFAERVTYSGTVDGALLAFGSEVIIGGVVQHSLASSGGEIRVEGEIKGSTFLLSQYGEISSEAILHRDCYAMCEELYFDGSTEGDLVVAGELAVITGSIEGDLKVYSDKLEIRESAVITGDIIIDPEMDPDIDNAAVILGDIIHRRVKTDEFPNFDLNLPDFLLPLYAFSSVFVLGILLLFVTGRHFHLAARSLHDRPARSAALAILGLGGSGVLIGVLFLTLVGIVASLLLGVFVLLFIWLIGQIYAAAGIGSLILGSRSTDSFALWTARLFVGVVVIAGLLQIPTVGWPLYLILGIYGLGGFISATLICRKSPGTPIEELEPATVSEQTPPPPPDSDSSSDRTP